MSRIGKKPIVIPENVSVEINGQTVVIKGPKGSLSQKLPPHVLIVRKDNDLCFSVKKPEEKTNRAFWGLARALVFNMVEGVTKGFEKKLELKGVGFRVESKDKKLILVVGFSHPVEFALPQGIEGKADKNIITVSGIDKQLVGDTAAKIREIKKPEPYKGKGIKYLDETIRRKAGKVAKGAE